MVYFIAGAAAGLIFMLAFVAFAPVMVFSLARHTESQTGGLVRRANPTTLMLGLVVVAYPVWTLFGGMLGLLYRLGTQVTPGSGLGSGNLVYTLVLAFVALLVAVPGVVLLRRVALGVFVITVAFVGIYGWLLPFLVDLAER